MPMAFAITRDSFGLGKETFRAFLFCFERIKLWIFLIFFFFLYRTATFLFKKF